MPPPGAASGTAREKTAKHDSTSPEDVKFAEKIDDQVSLVDVAPTLLEIAGIAIPKAVQGQSLLPLLKPASAQPVRAIFSESDYPFDIFHWSVLRSWRNGKYLYVEAPKRELYDQASDPKAAKNLALTSPAIADTLNAQAESFRKSTTSGAAATVKLNPEQVAKLSSLGYIASEIRSGTEGEVGGIDPKDRIEIANLFHDGLVFSEEHRYQDAIKALERVVESEPDSGLAYSHLGTALMRAKDFDKALPVLRKAAQLHAESSLNQYQLGRALLQTGKVQESLAHFEKAVELTPSAEYRFSLATVYVRLGRDKDALKQLDMALETEPKHYRANLLRGAILADYQPSEALANLEAAATANPTASEPHAYLAKAYERLGNTTKAEEEHRKAKELGGPH
jgi:tetratricopeptide (TPR) repeat protein